MSQNSIRPVFAMLWPLLVSGCALLPDERVQVLATSRPIPAPYLVAQVGFGKAARFGLCVPPACPSVTAKHLASAGMQAGDGSGKSPPVDSSTAPGLSMSTTSSMDVLSVYFDSGKANVTDKARRSIDTLVAGAPAPRVRIAAYTDSTGSPERNRRLAEERAAAVSRYIQAIPVLANVVVDVEAMAMCCYVATNANATGRRLNRRVDIAFIDTGQDVRP